MYIIKFSNVYVLIALMCTIFNCVILFAKDNSDPFAEMEAQTAKINKMCGGDGQGSMFSQALKYKSGRSISVSMIGCNNGKIFVSMDDDNTWVPYTKGMTADDISKSSEALKNVTADDFSKCYEARISIMKSKSCSIESRICSGEAICVNPDSKYYYENYGILKFNCKLEQGEKCSVAVCAPKNDEVLIFEDKEKLIKSDMYQEASQVIRK